MLSRMHGLLVDGWKVRGFLCEFTVIYNIATGFVFCWGGAGRNFRLTGGAGRVGKPDKALERKEFVGS